jgi:hypothetical protein
MGTSDIHSAVAFSIRCPLALVKRHSERLSTATLQLEFATSHSGTISTNGWRGGFDPDEGCMHFVHAAKVVFRISVDKAQTRCPPLPAKIDPEMTLVGERVVPSVRRSGDTCQKSKVGDRIRETDGKPGELHLNSYTA